MEMGEGERKETKQTKPNQTKTKQTKPNQNKQNKTKPLWKQNKEVSAKLAHSGGGGRGAGVDKSGYCIEKRAMLHCVCIALQARKGVHPHLLLVNLNGTARERRNLRARSNEDALGIDGLLTTFNQVALHGVGAGQLAVCLDILHTWLGCQATREKKEQNKHAHQVCVSESVWCSHVTGCVTALEPLVSKGRS